MKVVSWNINRQDGAWHSLVDSDYDIALVQEAAAPPKEIAEQLEINPGAWETAGAANRPWRTAIVKLSDKVEIEWISCQPIDTARPEELAVSRMGTIAAARVTEPGSDPVILFSCYSVWESCHPGGSTIYADASAHRIISDLSSFMSSRYQIIVAGDWNILNRYGEHGDKYFGVRYSTVFDRMEAIGLTYQGPQAPSGRPAHPHPDELPVESKDVPTYHTRQQGPKDATRQLDFVFCSPKLAKGISVVARNDVDDWGPSDHCRVEIACNP